MRRVISTCRLLGALLLLAVALQHPAAAQENDAELEELKSMLRILAEQNEKQQKQIEELQRRLDRAEGARGGVDEVDEVAADVPTDADNADAAALNAALAEIEAATPATSPPAAPAASSLYARPIGGTTLRLIDISFDLLTSVGSSTEGGSSLGALQGGAHDPNRRGFTLQQGELSLTGAVDPFFSAEAHIVFGTDFIEIEEAFFRTTALPFDLQLKGGLFFTPFGRINPVHPHAWKWLDQPFMNTRLFGGDGLRSPGLSLSWLTPLPWYAELVVGAQNADEGELTLSFLNGETGVGGRPAPDTSVASLGDILYHARAANSWDLSDQVTAILGFSGLFGANATGSDGRTYIYGSDWTVKWLPRRNFRGWPFLLWETEVTKRDYTADSFVSTDPAGGGGDLPGEILRDWGGYSQMLWGFRHPWAAGARVEYGSGSGRSVTDGVLDSRQLDPLRGDRFRFSPLFVYHPTHFSRLRLQYNLDHATFLSGDDLAHSVWLSAEIIYGQHPAHQY